MVCLFRLTIDNAKNMLDKSKKNRIIKKFQAHENDTGSPQVQIALLTTEIKELIDHLKEHKKDHSSRRGLLRKVNERKKLMRYLKRDNQEEYGKLAESLNLKG